MDKGWQVVDRRLLVDRNPYARVFDRDVRLPDGEVIKNFVEVDLPPFAIIFAVLEDGHVPVVRQFRMGASAYTLELPAGHLADGEDPLEAARRELREEAGLEAASWKSLGKYIMDANRGCGWCHSYLARGARRIGEPQHGDLGEMSVQWLTVDEIRRAWASGTLVSAPTTLCVGLALHALK